MLTIKASNYEGVLDSKIFFSVLPHKKHIQPFHVAVVFIFRIYVYFPFFHSISCCLFLQYAYEQYPVLVMRLWAETTFSPPFPPSLLNYWFVTLLVPPFLPELSVWPSSAPIGCILDQAAVREYLKLVDEQKCQFIESDCISPQQIKARFLVLQVGMSLGS